MKKKDKKLLFISSAGGHLAQILQLEPLFDKYEYKLLTENISATQELKEKYNVDLIEVSKESSKSLSYWVNFIYNIILAVKYMIVFKPNVIISTGSHIAVPYCFVAKIFRKNVIYILTYARINSKAKSADIVYPISDLFIVQWESMLKYYSKAKFLGGGLY